MIMPEVLLVENYRTLSRLGLLDTTLGIAFPYLASAFGIFLFRQTFKSIPKELEEAARLEGANPIQVLFRVFVPLAKPTYIAYGPVSYTHLDVYKRQFGKRLSITAFMQRRRFLFRWHLHF